MQPLRYKTHTIQPEVPQVTVKVFWETLNQYTCIVYVFYKT